MLQFFTNLLGRKARSTTKPPRSRPQARLELEELMPRILPSASSSGLAVGHFLGHHGHAAVMDSSSDNAAVADSSTSGHAGDACGTRATLVANLTNASGATGTASFNATAGTLKVQVQGAAASTSLDVMVDGTSVGAITTDASGNGQIKLANTTVQAGSTISVGDLTGTFSQVKFTASLSGDSGATGSATYDSVKNRLRVSIAGTAANTTYNVTVNDVVVGQLTTNAAGKGKLYVSPSSATIQAGSTIAIGDTVGNPAILQGSFA